MAWRGEGGRGGGGGSIRSVEMVGAAGLLVVLLAATGTVQVLGCRLDGRATILFAADL